MVCGSWFLILIPQSIVIFMIIHFSFAPPWFITFLLFQNTIAMFDPFTVLIHALFYLTATQSAFLTSSIVIHTALCLFDFKPISMSCIEVGSNAYLQSWQTLRKCWNVESSWQTLLKEFLCLSHLSIKRAARESWFPIFLIFLICNSSTYFRSILLKAITPPMILIS